jgi:putative membrane protein
VPVQQQPLFALVIIWTLGLLISGASPYERSTWLMEVAPCLVLLPILWATRKRFSFTPLVYVLMTIHGLILMVGGAYTYARVPLGFWMQHWFNLTRNDYDKIGHFAQGFVPAFVAREMLIRIYALTNKRLVGFLSVCICLAISAFYELIEWWSALWLGSGADEFLGTQGDVWDTQSDMFMALIGALCAMVFSGWHDAAIKNANQKTG